MFQVGLRVCALDDLFILARCAVCDLPRMGRSDGVGAVRIPHCVRGPWD